MEDIYGIAPLPSFIFDAINRFAAALPIPDVSYIVLGQSKR